MRKIKKTYFELDTDDFEIILNALKLFWMPVCIIIGIEHEWFVGFIPSLIHHSGNIIITIPSFDYGTVLILCNWWPYFSHQRIKPKLSFKSYWRLLIRSWKLRWKKLEFFSWHRLFLCPKLRLLLNMMRSYWKPIYSVEVHASSRLNPIKNLKIYRSSQKVIFHDKGHPSGACRKWTK